MKTKKNIKIEENIKNQKVFFEPQKAFCDFFIKKIKEKKLKQNYICRVANISYKYGNKIINGSKTTKERDTILRLCYAAELTLSDVRKCLMLYGMAPLYSHFKRDAILIDAFRTRPGEIDDINKILKDAGCTILKEKSE